MVVVYEKNIEESYKCVTQSWMRNEYDESVVERFPLKNGNFTIKIKDKSVLLIE